MKLEILIIVLVMSIALLTWGTYWITIRHLYRRGRTDYFKRIWAAFINLIDMVRQQNAEAFALIDEELSVENKHPKGEKEESEPAKVLSHGEPIVIKDTKKSREFRVDISKDIYVAEIPEGKNDIAKNDLEDVTVGLSCDCWEDWKVRTGQMLSEKQLADIAMLYNEEQVLGLVAMYSNIQATLLMRVRGGGNWQKGCDMAALFFGLRIEALLNRQRSFVKVKKTKK